MMYRIKPFLWYIYVVMYIFAIAQKIINAQYFYVLMHGLYNHYKSF